MEKIKSVLTILNMIPWDLVVIILLSLYATASEVFGSSNKFKHSAVWKYVWHPIGTFLQTFKNKGVA